MAINYLELGDLIVERLSEQISSVEYISTAIDFASITGLAIVTPSLYVVYIDDSLGDNAGQGIAYEIKQTWGVVVVIKNLQETNYKFAELGKLISEVISSIQGWMPDSQRYGPLYREASPAPVQGDGGYIYFPIYFSSRFLTSGI